MSTSARSPVLRSVQLSRFDILTPYQARTKRRSPFLRPFLKFRHALRVLMEITLYNKQEIRHNSIKKSVMMEL